MTLNKTISKLPTDPPLLGGLGNAFGQKCSFQLPTEHQTGALLKGPILATSEVAITGNVVITIDPLSKIPSGTLTVAGATTLNGVVSINAATNIVGAVNVTGTVTATAFSGTINVQPWKSFDIRHPNKEGWRLRHVCVEGPEAAVYIRGKLVGNDIIELPEYWKGLVDYESISVDLTPFDGPDSSLYVKGWNEDAILVGSQLDTNLIKTYYRVTAARLGEMVVEYEGDTVDDYPGDPTNFTYQG
jgi:hypothetical protein